MPSVIKLVNGDTVYATQEPDALAKAATASPIVTVNVDGKPDVYVVVSSIATIAEGHAPSRRASFA